MGLYGDAALGQGFAQAAGGFSDALLRIADRRRRKSEEALDRKLQRQRMQNTQRRLAMEQERIGMARDREERLSEASEARTRMSRWRMAVPGQAVPPDLLSRDPSEVIPPPESEVGAGMAGTLGKAVADAARQGVGQRVREYNEALAPEPADDPNRVSLRGYEIPVDPTEDPSGYAEAVRSIEGPVMDQRLRRNPPAAGGGEADRGPDPSEVRQIYGELLDAYTAEDLGGKTPPDPKTRQALLDAAERIATGDTTVTLPGGGLTGPEGGGGPEPGGGLQGGGGGGRSTEPAEPDGMGLDADQIQRARDMISRRGLSDAEARQVLKASGATETQIETILGGG